VTFIREGGLEKSRERQRERLVEEQQRLRRMQHEIAQERRQAAPQYVRVRDRNPLGDILADMFGLGF
jgi:hypothetical protein